MATVTYGDALSNFDYPPDYFNFNDFSVVTATSTRLELEDNVGATIVILGTGLDYPSPGVVVGQMTSYRQTLADGGLLLEVTGADLDIATVYAGLTDHQDILVLLSGDDLVQGGARRDIVVGGDGDDTLKGNDGADVLIGMAGRDKMSGGAGRDVFIFGYGFVGKNSGVDTVVDFKDTDGKKDDLIYIDESDYANLTVTQSGDDVILDFGKADLVLRNMLVAQIGLDDFTFLQPI